MYDCLHLKKWKICKTVLKTNIDMFDKTILNLKNWYVC